MISSLGDRNPMQCWPFCQGPGKRSLYKCDTWIGINPEDICFLLPVSCLIKVQVIFTTVGPCRFIEHLVLRVQRCWLSSLESSLGFGVELLRYTGC